MTDAERWALEATLERLVAERDRARPSCGGPLPDVATLERHAAYTAGLDEEIAELYNKLGREPTPKHSTLHSRPPLPPGWQLGDDDDGGVICSQTQGRRRV